MWLTNYIVQDCKPSIPILNNQLYTHLPVLFHVLTLFSRNSIMWNSLYLKITRNSLYLKIFSWSSFKLLTIHLPKSRQNKAKSSPPLYDHIVYFVYLIATMKVHAKPTLPICISKTQVSYVSKQNLYFDNTLTWTRTLEIFV